MRKWEAGWIKSRLGLAQVPTGLISPARVKFFLNHL